mmetsp:Transcript_30403/g.30903  ORF Transcript_30403/g.30903 Transcript_30403/m.30903 type:complete len:153 (-) Transcript_30403:74-532(-)
MHKDQLVVSAAPSLSLSSLSLQIIIYFNYHFSCLFFLINIGLFVYKALRYYFPAYILGWELSALFLYVIIEMIRLLLVSKGNKTISRLCLSLSLFLAIPILVLHVYYMELQTYVLRVDLILNIIGLCFLSGEVLISVFVLLSFVYATNSLSF